MLKARRPSVLATQSRCKTGLTLLVHDMTITTRSLARYRAKGLKQAQELACNEFLDYLTVI